MSRIEKVILTINILLIMLISSLFIIQPGIYCIYGDSMQPTLNDGDKVLIGRWIYNEGDIIAVRWAEKRMKVIHRIYKIDGDHYYTWGDDNPAALLFSFFVMYGNIIGKLLYVW